VTTAFVLSGGGSLGAVQVGMLRALTERRIVPDLLVGTSRRHPRPRLRRRARHRSRFPGLPGHPADPARLPA
jgi:Patatin-like phospholipase